MAERESEKLARLKAMLPADVSLHAGMMKTGSTAIQNAFEKNQAFLLDRGVLFPRSVLVRGNAFFPRRCPGHLELLNLVRRDRLDAFIAEAGSAQSRAETLMLSAEHLFADIGPEQSEALRLLLQGKRVTLLCFLRSQPEWAASRYYEAVARGRSKESDSFEGFVGRLIARGRLDYHARLKHLAGLTGAVRVIALDYGKVGRGAVRAALDALGIAEPLPEPVPETDGNPSYPFPEGIEAQRRLNALAGGLSVAEHMAWAGEMEAAAEAMRRKHRLPVSHLRVGPMLARRILEACRESNRRLSLEFLGGVPFGPDEGILEENEPPALDDKVVAALMRRGAELLAPHLGAAARKAQARTASLEGQLAGADRKRAALEAELAAQKDAAARLRRKKVEQERRIARLRASTSWRVTAPLRAVARLAGRLRGRRQPS